MFTGLVGIIIWLAIGMLCHHIAKKYYTHPILWGILGLVFNLLALIVLLVLVAIDMSKKKEGEQ